MSRACRLLRRVGVLTLWVVSGCVWAQEGAGVVAPGATLEMVADGFQFTEGPAADREGNVFFTDVRASRIHEWTVDDGVSVFRENTGGANGLFFDKKGNLLACEGGNGRIVSIDPEGNVTVVADEYGGKRFNRPNDLWIDPKGGVYFSDPLYGRGQPSQDGEHVYYVSPDRKRVTRVIDDMVRPNGLIGLPDGKTLYVADAGAGKTYRYTVNDDGSLADKALFVESGSDGMTLDSEGNVYLTESVVAVYDSTGKRIGEIQVPERPTNVTFCGSDGKTLFITARGSVHSIRMRVQGVSRFREPTGSLPDTGQTGDFTATFGEDFDYSISPPSYTDNGDGTVTDAVTGLMWQQADGGEMTWEDARAYAERLSLAGHDDWRLPTSQELFDLVDHGSGKPALNAEHFPVSAAEYWWSGTERAGDSSRAWVVNAGGGIGPHRKSESISAGGTRRVHVRCVRTAQRIGEAPAAARFIAHGDGTVTDGETDLVWQQADAGAPMTWEEALAYCEGLSLGGHDDWRLPNIKELRSINDDGESSPSVDARVFPGTQPTRYWSSTTEGNHSTRAWFVDLRYGLVSYAEKPEQLRVRAVRGGLWASASAPGIGAADPTPDGMVLIPGGTFEMGDHHDLGGREHRNDEVPVHTVTLDPFYTGMYEVTNRQYCEYLNAALKQRLIEVRGGNVYAVGGREMYCETRASVAYSRIGWDGEAFTVLDSKDDHPMVGVRWEGAAAYCNWLSAQKEYQPCYDLSTWKCDFARNGYRLPTEAEWEYAGRGGNYQPYCIYPWADEADRSKANWPRSGDPYEAGPYPWTTPVGFYNGVLYRRADFGWPGPQQSYQTADGSNGYGLYDMAGNVWEWCNDWYTSDYYARSASVNPGGPDEGRRMPDGRPYRVLRSGNWYNGPEGHSRVSNRNPAYYRGPDDPNHPWYHIGLRVVRNAQGGDRRSGNPEEAPSGQPARSARGDAERRVAQAGNRGPGGRRQLRDGQRPRPPGQEAQREINRRIGLIKNSDQAFPGYTLFAPKHFLFTYLMTNDGQVVNSWASQYEPGQSVYLLPNGHLLHCCFTRNPGFIGGGEGGRLEEYDWEGNLVWEYWCSDDQKLMHHDIEPLPNGNILAMVVEKKSYEECIAAGFPPQALRERWLFPDYVVEVEPTRPEGGKIVWEWHVWDHLIQEHDPAKPNYGRAAEHPELIDVNVNGRGVRAFWNHMNSIDYNAELDQIMLSVRGCSELWIIDHSTPTQEAAGHTGGRSGKGGGLLYRWGNPVAYGRGDVGDQTLFQQHDAQWIESGCPGEGNILIFNNGLNRLPPGAGDRRDLPRYAVGRGWGYSSVDELVPPVEGNGQYVLEPGAAYGPTKPIWTYVAGNPTDFFAEAISGAQRLPNGNMLICDGTSGVFFEVTREGDTVWEYVCPVTGDGPIKQGDPIPLDHRAHAMNAVFKIHRYPVDYPGLAGKALTPEGLITGSTPDNVPENLSRQPVGQRGRPDGQQGGRQPGDRRGRGGPGGGRRF